MSQIQKPTAPVLHCVLRLSYVTSRLFVGFRRQHKLKNAGNVNTSKDRIKPFSLQRSYYFQDECATLSASRDKE